QHEVCFPAVTGTAFVPAQSLELYRGLSAQGLLTFRRYFHLARMPYVTLALIALLVAAYFGWQGGRPASIEQLVQQGAKSPPLMRELGQWWRLLTANGLHISGWHLAANAVFLFNLGGPAEAVFRRLDYLIIVAASSIGAMLFSTLASPLVSCGASGIVFGVWGAAAVFGMRYRELLPDRYRRYFIGSVIPYSLFALYLGFAIPGVDNWSHLGGLATGSALAMVLPPRLMAPRDSWVHAKLFAFAAAALLLAALGLDPPGVGPLSPSRYYAATGLVVPVPRRWDLIAQERTRNHESYAFANGAGVAVALQGRLEAQPVDLGELGKRFVERDLAAQLEAAQSRGHRIHEPVPVTVAG
ncbi:MAG: rhomboid family intramembrane serine protease, partial [Deltaproteobacteria bacterium]|nr:rhomboid family intramembrane serine protease [Deltaproteobacteria bacterium]